MKMISVLKKVLSKLLLLCCMAALFTMPFHASANKVKIKRDFIYIDKKKTPLRVEKGDNNTYIFTDSDSGEIFVTASYKIERVDEETSFQWLVLQTDKSPFANEIDLEYLSFTLSVKKAITEFMLKRLAFFDTKGTVNKAKINEFFAQQRVRESLTEQAIAKKKAAKSAERLAEQEARFEQTARLGLSIKKETREIFRKIDIEGLPDGLIGTYRFSGPETIVLRDLDKTKIATITQDVLKHVTVSSSFLSEPLSYDSRDRLKRGAPDDTRAVVLEVVRHLHARGVLMGHEAKGIVAQYNADVRAEDSIKYEEAKANSSNVYDHSGYAIDHKGVRYDGKITAIFEAIDATGASNILDLRNNNHGSEIKVEYLNTKKQKKLKKLSASKENLFCIFVENGKEDCYTAVKIKSNGLLAAAGNNTLNINLNQNNKFLRKVIESADITVFQDPASEDFYLKSRKQKKAFNFKFGPLVKEARKASKLKDYLSGCDYVNDSYDENALRFDIDKVQELVDYYDQNCR
jgi:hypothetical protein